MKLVLLVFLSLIMITGCNHTSVKQNKLSDAQYISDEILSKQQVDSLWRMAINDGDFTAYNKISNYYLQRLKNYELYYYALIMANKHQCPEAYEQLYFILTSPAIVDGVNMVSNDSLTRNQAMFYLLKAYELGSKDAQYSIQDLFGDSIPPTKSDIYLKKIEENYRRLEKKQ
ncbi:hypothetical protein K7A41_00515 [Sphingobacterium sp. InxBP1]|uniref:hypothetical protein n=1 Tax=Sphingobacterium sp. InxBP1 TaxID=2870328 RepID=UPI0022445146|nr:hypothetical protein [Sphingobacterium sp. InxBP1]MCW8309703.1 hypothetical protein [Sphingobacterium sp. InxBP1]